MQVSTSTAYKGNNGEKTRNSKVNGGYSQNSRLNLPKTYSVIVVLLILTAIMSFPPPASPPVTSLHLPHPDAYPGEPREYARALMQRKDEIEKEMVSWFNALWSSFADVDLLFRKR